MVAPQIHGGERLRVRQVRVEGQQQRGAFLDETDPGVPVAVHAALVPFGLSAPAFQVEGLLRPLHLLTPDKQPGGKAGHHAAHLLPERIVAGLARLRQALKRRLTLGTRATVQLEGRLDGPDVLHVVAHSRLGVVDCRQPPVDVARYTRQTVMRRPPFFASTVCWSEACTSSKASATRRPGGWRGPP